MGDRISGGSISMSLILKGFISRMTEYKRPKIESESRIWEGKGKTGHETCLFIEICE